MVEIVQTPDNIIDYLQPHLNVSEFEKLIIDYGYNVYIENAIKCPCNSRNINVSLRTCINCRGLGFIFIGRKESRLVLQQMNRNQKYEVWNENNTGIVSITAKYIDRLAVYDKIILIDGEDIFTENLNVRDDDDNTKTAYTIYDIKEVLEVYKFKEDNEGLILLEEEVDYVFESNKIILTSKYDNVNSSDISISIRYIYRPEYIVIDIPRNIMIQDSLNCSSDLQKSNFPIKAVGRILHYKLHNS